MKRFVSILALLAATAPLAGCMDSTSPARDAVPPAAPRGVASVTGDHKVYLHWLANTETDLGGYRVYQAAADAPNGPYTRIGETTQTIFTVTGLTNGVTHYYAVSAFDQAGIESPLSPDDVFDTPRPEGFDQVLTDAAVAPAASGWDFAEFRVRSAADSLVDVYYVRQNGVDLLVAPFADVQVQDAGFASTLDAVDFSPLQGWSPTGTAELVQGHCYVIAMLPAQDFANADFHRAHFAKIRVGAIGGGSLTMDWAYQIDPGNRELRARPSDGAPAAPRPRRTGTLALR